MGQSKIPAKCLDCEAVDGPRKMLVGRGWGSYADGWRCPACHKVELQKRRARSDSAMRQRRRSSSRLSHISMMLGIAFGGIFLNEREDG